MKRKLLFLITLLGLNSCATNTPVNMKVANTVTKFEGAVKNENLTLEQSRRSLKFHKLLLQCEYISKYTYSCAAKMQSLIEERSSRYKYCENRTKEDIANKGGNIYLRHFVHTEEDHTKLAQMETIYTSSGETYLCTQDQIKALNENYIFKS